MIRRWLATVGVLALVATALAGIAHASGLALAAPTTASLDVVRKCAQADVQVTGAVGRDQLTVSGLPAACGNLPMRLWLHEAGTTQHVDAVTPSQGGTLSVTLPTPVGASPTAVATVRTWPMPTTARISDFPTFTCRTPGSSAGCTVTVTERDGWDGFWRRAIQVSTTSPTPVRWEVTMDLSAYAPFQTNQVLDQSGRFATVAPVDCTRTPRTVTVGGRSPYELVSSATPLAAGLQGATTVNPHHNPEAVLFTCP